MQKKYITEKPRHNTKHSSGNISIKKCWTKKVLDITANETKSNNTVIIAIRNDTNQRKCCKANDSRINLDKLLNPTLPHECASQKINELNDANLEDLPDYTAKNNNFEDYLGLCSSLGHNLNCVLILD